MPEPVEAIVVRGNLQKGKFTADEEKGSLWAVFKGEEMLEVRATKEEALKVADEYNRDLRRKAIEEGRNAQADEEEKQAEARKRGVVTSTLTAAMTKKRELMGQLAVLAKTTAKMKVRFSVFDDGRLVTKEEAVGMEDMIFMELLRQNGLSVQGEAK